MISKSGERKKLCYGLGLPYFEDCHRKDIKKGSIRGDLGGHLLKKAEKGLYRAFLGWILQMVRGFGKPCCLRVLV